ncbi:DUF3299 domain-containing protein [bacterium CPR1]|nr:DUF3299 domain-containing protein [bacterium CPR1]
MAHRIKLFLGVALLIGVALVAGNPRMVFKAPPRLTPSPSSSGSAYEKVGFQALGGFSYEPKKSRLPESVTRYNGKKVSIDGFMVPVDMDKDGVSSFVLVKDQMMCCYGATPALNEWVYVSLEKRAPVAMDQPITVYGDLQVGEDVQDGEVISLYRMSGERIELPQSN